MQDDSQAQLIIVLVVVLILALLLNYYFYKRQEALEQKRILSKQLKSKIENVLNVLVALKSTACDAELLGLFSDYANQLLEQLNRLSPNPTLAQQVQNTRSGTRESELTLDNPNLVKQAQHAIGQAQPILKELKEISRITPILFTKYNREIQWLYTVIEVDAHLALAKNKAEAGNKPAAILQCNYARTSIARTVLKDPRKEAKTAEINKLIDEWMAKPKSELNEGNADTKAVKPLLSS